MYRNFLATIYGLTITLSILLMPTLAHAAESEELLDLTGNAAGILALGLFLLA